MENGMIFFPRTLRWAPARVLLRGNGRFGKGGRAVFLHTLYGLFLPPIFSRLFLHLEEGWPRGEEVTNAENSLGPELAARGFWPKALWFMFIVSTRIRRF